MRHQCLVFCVFLMSSGISAQNPATDHAWLTTDNIAVRITPTGIHADSTGGFLLNRDGATPVNLLSHLTPWVGGLDPAGNLSIAAEMSDPSISDWTPGFRGIPNSGKVWKVTQAQIAAHLDDFHDNGVVDNPIPEIFSWPARGNAFSLVYNGFEAPSEWNAVSARFFDEDVNGFYNPENGDHPVVPIWGISHVLSPEEMTFAAFFNDTTGLLTHGRSVHLDASLQALVFDCNSNEFLENTVFLAYRYKFSGYERMDSTILGVYSDFNIGFPNDDYLGCSMPSSQTIYAYNADTLYDVVTAENPPMMGLNFFNGPWDTNGINIKLKKVMPIHNDTLLPWASAPQHPIEYYNYLSGSWGDGTPLTFGGQGHNGNTITEFPFPGHPADPNGWSELSASNPAGDRRVVVSYDNLTLLPNMQTEFVVSLTASNATGVSQQLSQLKEFKQLQNILINGYYWSDSVLFDLCINPLNSTETFAKIDITFFPNPANTHVTIQSSALGLKEVGIIDIMGKTVRTNNVFYNDNHDISIDLNKLPPGIYTLQWQLEDGRHGAAKLVVIR